MVNLCGVVAAVVGLDEVGLGADLTGRVELGQVRTLFQGKRAGEMVTREKLVGQGVTGLSALIRVTVGTVETGPDMGSAAGGVVDGAVMAVKVMDMNTSKSLWTWQTPRASLR